MNSYTYKQVVDWLLSELEYCEARADTLACRLSAMSDEDPHRATVNRLWQEQEAIIDAIGILRGRFREYDRKRSTDASHDMQREMARQNYYAQLASLGYGPDGNALVDSSNDLNKGASI